MGSGFFTTAFLQPLYNGLIFLMGVIPGADAGIAIIIFTLAIRVVLYPLSKKSIETQIKMRRAEGDIERIKANTKDKTEQAAKIMEFYKQQGLNPLSGFLFILLQIPIIIALYQVFLKSGLPQINTELLYTFIAAPSAVSMHFLGLIDIAQKSFLLSLFAAVSQFIQMKFSLPASKPSQPGGSVKDQFARSMNLQMRYLFPVMAFFIVYNLSGIIALYWTANNLFSIFQEWYVRRKLAPAAMRT